MVVATGFERVTVDRRGDAGGNGRLHVVCGRAVEPGAGSSERCSDWAALRTVFGPAQVTPLADAVATTVAWYRELG